MIFCDCVFSLRSWGIIFLGVGKALCFCGNKNLVQVFCREGPGLAGIGRLSRTWSKESTTYLPFSKKAPFRLILLAAMYSVTPTGEYRRSTRARWGEIFQAEDLIVCDGRQWARGECGVDFSTGGGVECILQLG